MTSSHFRASFDLAIAWSTRLMTHRPGPLVTGRSANSGDNSDVFLIGGRPAGLSECRSLARIVVHLFSPTNPKRPVGLIKIERKAASPELALQRSILVVPVRSGPDARPGQKIAKSLPGRQTACALLDGIQKSL